eukprot:1458072-Amphidinium_carterae.2
MAPRLNGSYPSRLEDEEVANDGPFSVTTSSASTRFSMSLPAVTRFHVRPSTGVSQSVPEIRSGR